MASHPFLKSIRPVNLLSFGPNTPEIELRPLNILIGPNGSGKSNLIEIIGLLSKLPDKDPWSEVIQTGGAQEWVWKGKSANGGLSFLSVITTERDSGIRSVSGTIKNPPLHYSISLSALQGGFAIRNERFLEIGEGGDPAHATNDSFERDDSAGTLLTNPTLSIPEGRSVLSVLGRDPYFSTHYPRMPELADAFEQFAFYRDWTFGRKSETRQLQPVGLDSYRLASDSINLAQVLKAMRDRGDSAVFDRFLQLARTFYEPVKDVDTELVGTSLRVMIKEDGLASRTPAERLSDGTLRWLTLLIILLDPTPPPVICIDEPDLGLHPDMIPTLSDLLREASTRTQLVITTHSRTLVECFSDEPDAVCVCEKHDGATEIERLDRNRLQVWLDKYSLGQLWSSGHIGGNRW
jgi:predicted ATPase